MNDTCTYILKQSLLYVTLLDLTCNKPIPLVIGVKPVYIGNVGQYGMCLFC